VMSSALRTYLTHHASTWQMQPDASYKRVSGRGPLKSAQQTLLEKLSRL